MDPVNQLSVLIAKYEAHELDCLEFHAQVLAWTVAHHPTKAFQVRVLEEQRLATYASPNSMSAPHTSLKRPRFERPMLKSDNPVLQPIPSYLVVDGVVQESEAAQRVRASNAARRAKIK